MLYEVFFLLSKITCRKQNKKLTKINLWQNLREISISFINDKKIMKLNDLLLQIEKSNNKFKKNYKFIAYYYIIVQNVFGLAIL